MQKRPTAQSAAILSGHIGLSAIGQGLGLGLRTCMLDSGRQPRRQPLRLHRRHRPAPPTASDPGSSRGSRPCSRRRARRRRPRPSALRSPSQTHHVTVTHACIDLRPRCRTISCSAHWRPSIHWRAVQMLTFAKQQSIGATLRAIVAASRVRTDTPDRSTRQIMPLAVSMAFGEIDGAVVLPPIRRH